MMTRKRVLTFIACVAMGTGSFLVSRRSVGENTAGRTPPRPRAGGNVFDDIEEDSQGELERQDGGAGNNLGRPESPNNIDRTSPGILPFAPEYYPRSENEWQGRLVDRTRRSECRTTEHCSLGLVCREDRLCGPCARSADCLRGEACVLDRCIQASSAHCSTERDCEGLCILVGSSEPRRGGDTSAVCEEDLEVVSQRWEPPDETPVAESGSPAISPQSLTRALFER